jgi:hypothetical protein
MDQEEVVRKIDFKVATIKIPIKTQIKLQDSKTLMDKVRWEILMFKVDISIVFKIIQN